MTGERRARLALAVVVLGLPMALAGAWGVTRASASPITVHGRVSEAGGWLPGTLRATAGVPLHLRLVSDDVMHGFAVGRSAAPGIDLPPGKVVETTLTFSQAGTYTYYCTHWCGPDHWRMRGVIEVAGSPASPPANSQPLYQALGIDLDASHPATVLPATRPSALRGQALGIELPAGTRTRDDFLRRTPADTWQALRRDRSTSGLSDAQVWDLVAHLWRTTTTADALREGQALFAQNCAACHGEAGAGDGVFASVGLFPSGTEHDSAGHLASPADFTNPVTMLGASTALLQGKILRGGMGTGMPYWGPILTDPQMWALADYLWTFQFEE
jgi:cytochrome c oxidase subunit 2